MEFYIWTVSHIWFTMIFSVQFKLHKHNSENRKVATYLRIFSFYLFYIPIKFEYSPDKMTFQIHYKLDFMSKMDLSM